MFVKTQKFLIFGLSKSGISATQLLLDYGAFCYITDENSVINNKQVQELINNGANYVEIDKIDMIMPIIDIIVVSPGIPINHEILVKMKKAKKRIIGELQLARNFTTSPIVAVTGTNGKTTTVSLLSSVLDNAEIANKTCGNIGIPMSAVIKNTNYDTLLITEVSSFQLETTTDLNAHIAVVLNITPDHLDRHYNMENYIFLKKRIFSGMRESEYLVLNYDDETVKNFANETKAKVIYFSAKTQLNKGA